MHHQETVKKIASHLGHSNHSSMDKLNPGDIVEILNLSKGQLYDIRSQNCDFNNDWAKEIIGMRYKVKKIFEEGSSMDGMIQLEGWNKGGHFGGVFHESQLMLYKSIKERAFPSDRSTKHMDG